MNRVTLGMLSACCVVLFSAQLFAVSEAAVLSLLISPSPQANAMGQSYGTLWSDDPMGSIFNPASVGLQAQNNFASYAYYPEKVAWFPLFTDNISYNSKAINIGFNLQLCNKIPLSVGVGYFDAYMDLGEQTVSDETGYVIATYSTYEKYDSFVLSAAVDYYIRAGFGYAMKEIDSCLGYGIGALDGDEARAQPKAHDWGFIIQAPIFTILEKMNRPVFFTKDLHPFFSPGFYYSKRNIGDDVVYIDAAQADPLPRQAYIGINFEMGLHFKARASSFDILHFRWAREMDDILVKREYDGRWEYLSGLNDIKFWDDVVIGKANDKAIKHQGYQIGLADVAFFRRGCYEDIEGNFILNSRGYGVNFTQPFRILAALLDYQRDKMWLNILLSLDIEYHESYWNTDVGHPLFGTQFKSLAIKLRNFEF